MICSYYGKLYSQNPAHRRELELAHERAETGLGLVEVTVVAKARLQGRVQPRLVRVELPGMQIENKGTSFPVDPPQTPTDKEIRKYTEVATTGDRDAHPRPA